MLLCSGNASIEYSQKPHFFPLIGFVRINDFGYRSKIIAVNQAYLVTGAQVSLVASYKTIAPGNRAASYSVCTFVRQGDLLEMRQASKRWNDVFGNGPLCFEKCQLFEGN
jgi:hypothetical protein